MESITIGFVDADFNSLLSQLQDNLEDCQDFSCRVTKSSSEHCYSSPPGLNLQLLEVDDVDGLAVGVLTVLDQLSLHGAERDRGMLAS